MRPIKFVKAFIWNEPDLFWCLLLGLGAAATTLLAIFCL